MSTAVMVMESSAVATAGGSAVLSGTLCTQAIAVYERLLRRMVSIEPDCGVAESFESGTRALQARAQVQPWAVPESVVEHVAELIQLVEAAEDDFVDDWIEDFPRAFLAAVDRRQRVDERYVGLGRRVIDRYR